MDELAVFTAGYNLARNGRADINQLIWTNHWTPNPPGIWGVDGDLYTKKPPGISFIAAPLIGLGGAIRSSFLVVFDLPKEVYVATSAMIAVVIDFTRIPTYVLTGSIQASSELFLIPFLIVSAYFGVRLGKTFLSRIDQQTFRRIVAVALLLVGLKLLI